LSFVVQKTMCFAVSFFLIFFFFWDSHSRTAYLGFLNLDAYLLFFFSWYTFFSFFKYITYNKSLWIWCNLLFVIIAQVIIQDLVRGSGLTVCNLCNDKAAPTLLMHDIFEHLQKKVL
jgi:hypothetical protein